MTSAILPLSVPAAPRIARPVRRVGLLRAFLPANEQLFHAWRA